MIDPSQLQADQSAIVQQETIELIERLRREGIDSRVVMTGVSSGIAAAVLGLWGPAEVSVFFARLSAMTMHLAEPQG